MPWGKRIGGTRRQFRSEHSKGQVKTCRDPRSVARALPVQLAVAQPGLSSGWKKSLSLLSGAGHGEEASKISGPGHPRAPYGLPRQAQGFVRRHRRDTQSETSGGRDLSALWLSPLQQGCTKSPSRQHSNRPTQRQPHSRDPSARLFARVAFPAWRRLPCTALHTAKCTWATSRLA